MTMNIQKKECSMHDNSIQNIPAEEYLYICLKDKKFRKSIPFSS